MTPRATVLQAHLAIRVFFMSMVEAPLGSWRRSVSICFTVRPRVLTEKTRSAVASRRFTSSIFNWHNTNKRARQVEASQGVEMARQPSPALYQDSVSARARFKLR